MSVREWWECEVRARLSRHLWNVDCGCGQLCHKLRVQGYSSFFW